MKTFTALAAAAVLMTSISTGSANAQMAGFAAAKAPTTEASQAIVHKTRSRRGGRRHGGKIAAGIALGILGAAAIAHQSHRYSDSYESRHERRCRRWMYRCEDGNYRACNKFDRRC